MLCVSMMLSLIYIPPTYNLISGSSSSYPVISFFSLLWCCSQPPPTSSTHTSLFCPFAVQRLQSAASDCSPILSSIPSLFFEKIFWAVIQLSSRLLLGPALVLLPTYSTHTLLFGPFAVQRLHSAATDCSPIPFSILSLFFEKIFWAVIQLSSRFLVGPALALLPTLLFICC
jgi:hypothetical protein